MATDVDAKQKEHILVDDLQLKLNFNLSKSEIEETKEMYGTQCNGLKHKEQQKDLWKCLAIARKNKLPLLTLIIDSFTRDRIDYFIKHNKPLPLQQWIVNYPTLKILSKEKKHHMEMLGAAVSTFLHRYSAMIQLPVIEKYNDSLKEFTNYIIEATSFINTILDGDRINPPFQIELLIIPQRVTETGDDDDTDDDDDDDDDFDDDDTDDDDSEHDKKDKYDPYSEIGDIKTRLNENKIIYEYKVLSKGFRPRVFHELFSNLKDKSRLKRMPHNQRLCIVVDRRKGFKCNELFMYKPDIASDFPEHHVNEWYFESSFSCIIPGKYQNDIITAKTAAKGYVFCLSFQIEQRDSMKCYLYTRSQMIRFLPSDIHNVLPLFFVADGDNHNFVQNEKKDGNATKRIKLIDIEFDKFRKQTSMIKNQ